MRFPFGKLKPLRLIVRNFVLDGIDISENFAKMARQDVGFLCVETIQVICFCIATLSEAS